MTKLAIIGGSGLERLNGLQIVKQEAVSTPYGEPSDLLCTGILGDKEIIFLPRHGSSHHIPPHNINYRANIWALKQHNVTSVVGINAVGGINKDMSPSRIVIPDQIIDYTWGRESTFHEPPESGVVHIDFSYPYAPETRAALLGGAERAKLQVFDGGVYGATQGPRLETAAEIDRMERDGCHLVGMTGMPEAALAREAGLRYATCALVVNPAAGRGDAEITMDEIRGVLERGMVGVRHLLRQAVQLIGTESL